MFRALAEAKVEFVETVLALDMNLIAADPIQPDPAPYLSTRSTLPLGSLDMPRTGTET